ncbi:MAG: hypothetical protein KDM91_07475 [Verrucomicrobiae bacterium]|nr:hypothetical protein [Verrucomicrobiae bacterium]MCP5550352.1 hypothetical protein [Akkermansiaceae bacterium]
MRFSAAAAATVCLASLALAATSCIDYTEEFTIKANGSGTIHSTISLKEELADDDPDKLKRDLEGLFANAKGLSLADYRVIVEPDRRVTDFTIAFDHVKDLGSVLESGGGGGDMLRYFGTFEAEETADRYRMKRTIDLSGGDSGKPDSGGGALAKLITSALLSDSRLTYRMSFPSEVLAANTRQIDPKTNTVEWTFTVAQAIRTPLEMTAEIRKPPLLKWLLIAGAAVVVVVGAILLLRRRPA